MAHNQAAVPVVADQQQAVNFDPLTWGPYIGPGLAAAGAAAAVMALTTTGSQRIVFRFLRRTLQMPGPELVKTTVWTFKAAAQRTAFLKELDTLKRYCQLTEPKTLAFAVLVPHAQQDLRVGLFATFSSLNAHNGIHAISQEYAAFQNYQLANGIAPANGPDLWWAVNGF